MIRRLVVMILVITVIGPFALGQITVTGKIMWQDRNGAPHPVRGAKVQIWNAQDNSPFQQRPSFTAEDGSYTTAIADQAGNVSILIKVFSESDAALVHPETVTQPYEFESSIHASVGPGSTLNVNLTGSTDEINDQAFSVLEAVTYGRVYVSSLGSQLAPIEVKFPVDGIRACGGLVSCFHPTDSSLNILLLDRWDWDVLMHEYGHYVSSKLSLDQNPGGQHYIDVNLEDQTPDKDTAIRLAWGEGWPTFFSISSQKALGLASMNVSFVGDTHYTDTEDSTLDVDLASQDGLASKGEDNELSVSRVLYYLFGGIPTAHGSFTMSGKAILDALSAKRVSTLSDSWDALTAGRKEDQVAAIGAIFADHLAAPSLLTPVDGGKIDGNPVSFTWQANGGAKSYLNSKFRLLFFDENWQPLLDSGDLTVPNYLPTKDEWDKIKNASALYWVVTGGNPDAPPTGPYSSFALSLKH